MQTNVRRTDNGDEIPAAREDLTAQLATLEPGFDPAGKSLDYLQARLDHARETATADAAAAKSRHRSTEAWKPAELREDAAPSVIDPDAMQRHARDRNANAWKK